MLDRPKDDKHKLSPDAVRTATASVTTSTWAVLPERPLVGCAEVDTWAQVVGPLLGHLLLGDVMGIMTEGVDRSDCQHSGPLGALLQLTRLRRLM